MLVQVTTIPVDQFFNDPLAIPVFDDLRPPHREAGRLDFRLAGMISRWIGDGTIDPRSKTPTLFTPGSLDSFPQVVISGAGAFHELSVTAVEDLVAGMTEVLVRAKAAVFGIAARDFRKAHTPPRDTSEILLRGLSRGCSRADVYEGHTIRIHWDEDQADRLVQELRRFRHHIPQCKGWEVERAPEDGDWLSDPLNPADPD